MAYRILLRRGEWDVDRLFATIPAGKWEELKVAHEIIESRDAWIESGRKTPWELPSHLRPKAGPRKRRRLNGQEF